jgi:hypothetical protein
MTTPLLTTKLCIPPPRPEMASRPRLTDVAVLVTVILKNGHRDKIFQVSMEGKRTLETSAYHPFRSAKDEYLTQYEARRFSHGQRDQMLRTLLDQKTIPESHWL